jgi:hypothetical protein
VIAQRLRQLQRHIDATPVGVLGRGDTPAYETPAYFNETSREVDVVPVHCEDLAQARASPQRQEKQRVVLRHVLSHGAQKIMRLNVRERLNGRALFVSRPQVLAHAKCGIRGQQRVLDRLREHAAQDAPARP